MERALRERRERPDLLDLVAEELDPERLASRRREDVDEAAADRDLPAFLGPLDAVVAGEREVLHDCVDAGLLARPKAQRLGPLVARRHAFGERRGRDADDAARGEHVEGAGALAHEVRRRLKARVPADAAARQVRDVAVAAEPADRLGEVARVRVLRQHDDELAVEPLVQRGDDERERGLRHARTLGQLLRVGGEAVVLRELADEGV
jgi:hypothetical protein